ncbi:phage holin, LLH family [Anaerolentibacter hominis]|uniref:phage holin, LLH family n=1 Tax=Anaerolentibacter hominis TaxID=3079009 RepID=UPI0031B84258
MELNDLLQSILYAVLTVTLPLLAKYAAGLIRAKTEDTKLAEISDIIASVVTCVTQTYVESLKKSGKFDKAAQQTAFETAKHTALAMLSREARELIAKTYGDIDAYLETKIEEYVNLIK